MMLFAAQDAGDAKADAGGARAKSRKRELLEWIVLLTLTFAFAICLRMFIFEFIRVEGPSMETTLTENEYMFVTKVEYLFGNPQRGDVIVCHYPDSKLEFVKRVVGVPGDTIQVMGGSLFVNDQRLDEPYLHELMTWDFGPYKVPEDSYFVMGDNRNISMDSRDPHVGALERNMVVGHVRAVVWPFKEMRWLTKAPALIN